MVHGNLRGIRNRMSMMDMDALVAQILGDRRHRRPHVLAPVTASGTEAVEVVDETRYDVIYTFMSIPARGSHR